MVHNWDEVHAITELTFIIQEETGLGLALSASVAERLWKEGYRQHSTTPSLEGFWYKDEYGHRCSSCNRRAPIQDDGKGFTWNISEFLSSYCPHCGSKNKAKSE